jgi:hypothetical protein
MNELLEPLEPLTQGPVSAFRQYTNVASASEKDFP